MDEKFCPYCGKKVVDNNCTGCGAIVLPENQLEAPPIEAPPPFVEPPKGIPWESKAKTGWFNALIENIRMVLGASSNFFQKMPPEGGIGMPLLYGLILGVAAVILSSLWSFVLNAMSLAPLGFLGRDGGAFGSIVGGTAIGIFGFIMNIIVGAIVIPITLFVSAGIYHLMLMILGGAERGFETTFRVVCYSQTAQIFQIVPILGSLVAMVWGLVLVAIGLREAHEIEGKIAVLAVLLPIIICCVLIGLVAMIFGAGLLALLGAGLRGR